MRAYPEGYRYTQFCLLLTRYRKTAKPSMPLEHKPAKTVMVDFAGDNLSYVGKATGKVFSCNVLVCVLPYCGYSFVKTLPSTTMVQLIIALNDCLSFFGGVPRSLKTDNMKQVVKPSRYEPTFIDAFTQWTQHYIIALTATRVAKPKDKAPVENEVKITYRRIYAPCAIKLFLALMLLIKLL